MPQSPSPAELADGLRTALGQAFAAELDEIVRLAESEYRRRARMVRRRSPEREAEAIECRRRLAELEALPGFKRPRYMHVRTISRETGWPVRRVRDYLGPKKAQPICQFARSRHEPRAKIEV